MRAYLRELCSLAALGIFVLGFAALGAVVVDGRDGSRGVTVAEATR